jgi:hypothetical protein
MPYFLHIAGGEFELPDTHAALELERQIQALQQAGATGRLHVPLKEPDRVVHIFVSAASAIAISGGDDATFMTPPDQSDPEIYIL